MKLNAVKPTLVMTRNEAIVVDNFLSLLMSEELFDGIDYADRFEDFIDQFEYSAKGEFYTLKIKD